MTNLYGWKEKAKEYMMVGSRVTCDPPPIDTDEDWIVLDLNLRVSEYLNFSMWDDCNSDYDDEDNDLPTKDITVYRKEHVNVLCMHSTDQYYKFKLATKLAKHFNLIEKSDRVMLFEAIRYGRGL